MFKDPVLAHEWIVACAASELTDQPKQVIVLGVRIVLWRTKRGVSAFRDLCVHRGAALSLGCVRDERLVCPYHGWGYEDSGACVHIPQLQSDQAITKRAQLTPYGCIEAYEMVWVNLQNADTPLFTLPEAANPQFHSLVWGPRVVHAKPPRIIENFLDVGHLSILHDGYLGDVTRPQIPDYHVHRHPNGGFQSDEIEVFQPNADGSKHAGVVCYTYDIIRPLSVKFVKRDPETNQRMSILLTVRPDEDDHSTVYGLMSFDYDTGLNNAELISFQDLIFNQDLPIVESQKPEDLWLDLQMELSLKCDRVSIAYRLFLTELGVTFGTA